MITKEGKLEMFGDVWKKVSPVHHVTSGGRDRDNEYTFSRVYVDDVDERMIEAPTNAEYTKPKDGVLTYQYGEKPKVLITSDGTYVKDGVNSRDGENQAYFALSVLSELGVVGNWSKK